MKAEIQGCDFDCASVIGLGKVGLPLAGVLAGGGLRVIGLDVDEKTVQSVNAGKIPLAEPGLQNLLETSRGRIRATQDFQEAVDGSVLSFVIVPTPSAPDGTFTNRFVLDAVRRIGTALRTKADYHLVVITSTVMPGSCSGEIRAQLEAAAGRPLGDTLGLCYSPLFIALGNVVQNLLRPDMILIGESDPRAGSLLADLYRRVCTNQPSVHRMNFVNAEITKLAVNTFITTRISYANMLSDLCDRLPEADVSVVTSALGSDSRIGSKYLQGAVGYGGPCFPRDNVALASLARNVGARPDLAEATHALNQYQVERLLALVQRHADPSTHVAVLGMSYKPDTPVIEESQGVLLAARLAQAGYRVTVYDPAATDAATALLGSAVQGAGSMADCVRDAGLIVLATPWAEFTRLRPADFRNGGQPPVIIDCWRILTRESFGDSVRILYPGSQPERNATAKAAAPTHS